MGLGDGDGSGESLPPLPSQPWLMLPTHRLILPNVATLLDAVALTPVDYRVEVKTSDRFKAGTSARVFCTLFGVQGSTGRYVSLATLKQGAGRCRQHAANGDLTR